MPVDVIYEVMVPMTVMANVRVRVPADAEDHRYEALAIAASAITNSVTKCENASVVTYTEETTFHQGITVKARGLADG